MNWGTLLENPVNVIGSLALVVAIIIMWRKDASNPALAASFTVVSSSAQYATDAFRVASDAMNEARESNRRAMEAETRAYNAEMSSMRCSQANQALADYCLILIERSRACEVTIPTPPRELTDWASADPQEG